MNFKHLIKYVIPSLIVIFGLSSCSCFNNSDISSYQKIDTPTEDRKIIREEGRAGTSINIDEVSTQFKLTYLKATGEQHVLVIPVYFSDLTPTTIFGENNEELARSIINNGFFGSSSTSSYPDATGWESVKSFYEKSSYGKLNLVGKVTSWCNLNLSLADALEQSNPSIYCLRKAVDWFKTNYSDEVSYYDQNNDGYLDAVCIIYANEPYQSSRYNNYTEEQKSKIKDFLWAYSSWDTSNMSIAKPQANAYLFASFSFLAIGKYYSQDNILLADAHTFIHEMGHLLGLDDYYSTDYDSTAPLGKLDMMDYNIGDHCSFSKYMLNWVSPVLIDHEGTYTLEDFETTGSCLLIPSDLDTFSYSPYGEYLMLELYSPTELNYLDSEEYYCGTYPKLFTEIGVKILSVDARLAVTDSLKKTYYFTSIYHDFVSNPFSSNKLIQAMSNTSSSSIEKNHRYIRLISPSHNQDYLYTNSVATNDDLYKTGNTLINFTFNSGKELKYQIKIENINSNNKSAQIVVSSL